MYRGCFSLAGSQKERQAERVRGEKMRKKEDRNTENRQKKERKRIQVKQNGG